MIILNKINLNYKIISFNYKYNLNNYSKYKNKKLYHLQIHNYKHYNIHIKIILNH
jgi:hypothetical protein